MPRLTRTHQESPVCRSLHSVCIVALCGLSVPCAIAQSSRSTAAEPSTSLQYGISLAEKGRCQEALPILKRALPHATGKEVKYKGAIQNAQCAMSVGRVDGALEALGYLNREFPDDPQALYITTHFCSQLAEGAAVQLAKSAPTSYQAQELDAEAFESHGNWEKASATYRKILEQYPKLPGIHYRLGRIILSQPATTTTVDDARKEFEAELKVDPSSAPAEFMLGDLARQQQQWDDAVNHYSRAAERDAGFLEAYLGLGMSLNAAARYGDAVRPLEKYTKSQPDDPAGHYQLALAYARTGKNEEAAHELAIQRQLDQKVNKDNKQ
jgi:tetratricopeptide (TPR) repeat protein